MWWWFIALLLIVLALCPRGKGALGRSALRALEVNLLAAPGEQPRVPTQEPAQLLERVERRVTPYQKKTICAEAKWRCASCHRIVDQGFEVDHRIPIADGGSNEAMNLSCLCRNCHRLKTSRESSARRFGDKRSKRRL